MDEIIAEYKCHTTGIWLKWYSGMGKLPSDETLEKLRKGATVVDSTVTFIGAHMVAALRTTLGREWSILNGWEKNFQQTLELNK